ncbi:MAG: hypothetical protein ACREEM_08690 [Blastocatellia bacterium]
MAKRIENECAFCAEEIKPEHSVIGEDRKVYCSASCAGAGESVSRDEMKRLLAIAWANRVQVPPRRPAKR